MQEILNNYAKAIVNDLLCLKSTDSLSINVEDLDFEFARLVAQSALEVTQTVVKIVVTENGRPIQVMDFEPEGLALEGRTPVMLRLSHRKMETITGPTLDVILDPNDMVAVQRFGHLADPIVLDRRISVPWCVAPVFEKEDVESWKKVKRILDSEISIQSLLTRYRKKALEEEPYEKLVFFSDTQSLSVAIPTDALAATGLQVLRSGREFLSTLDFDNLAINVDRISANGSMTCTAKVLGKKIKSTLVFKDGLLVDWTHSKELDQVLGFDENLRRIGYVSLRDNEFCLHLGSSITESLGTLPESEENLPEYFNTSLYTICFEMEGIKTVCMEENEEKRKNIVENGTFIS